MDGIFQNQPLWTIALALLLFLPVRQFIWAMSVRREERRLGRPTDDERRQSLRRRATVTSALLSFVFSVMYVQFIFKSLYPQQ